MIAFAAPLPLARVVRPGYYLGMALAGLGETGRAAESHRAAMAKADVEPSTPLDRVRREQVRGEVCNALTGVRKAAG